jgi:hypothetical protein
LLVRGQAVFGSVALSQRPFSKLFGQVRNLGVGVIFTPATNRHVVVLLKTNLLWANHALSVMQLRQDSSAQK